MGGWRAPRAARRCRAAASAGALALLAACGCPADGTGVLSDTREPLAAGTRAFAHQGPGSLLFDSAVARLKEFDQARGSARRYCGQRLAAGPGVTDAAIVDDLSRQLGPGWRAADEVVASQNAIRIYRWQSECSARFYALIAHQPMQRGTDYRPLVSMYPCGGG